MFRPAKYSALRPADHRGTACNLYIRQREVLAILP